MTAFVNYVNILDFWRNNVQFIYHYMKGSNLIAWLIIAGLWFSQSAPFLCIVYAILMFAGNLALWFWKPKTNA